jgi:hypothetical protein
MGLRKINRGASSPYNSEPRRVGAVDEWWRGFTPALIARLPR